MEYSGNSKTLSGKKPYKEPVFLFTSSSLRFAAYAGWYSAFGQVEKMDKLVNRFFKDIKDEIKKGKAKEKQQGKKEGGPKS